MDLLKELGDNGLKIMNLLVNKIYMSGDWPKNFLNATILTLPKKNEAKKCSGSVPGQRDHRGGECSYRGK